MGISSSLEIAATGLTAQRLRMDVIASNIAHAETTRTPAGGPYRRGRVVFSAVTPPFAQLLPVAGAWQSGFARVGSALASRSTNDGGVVVSGIVPDPSPFQRTYDPGHPDADEQGYVDYPNVDLTTEIADMLSATRAYEANITVVNASKSMALKALEIGRG